MTLPYSDPIAYFITWTTYGTWLSGDERGWVSEDEPGIQRPDPELEAQMRAAMTEPPVTLDLGQRALVDAVIRRHCEIRKWTLHAVNVRSNHVHVVVTAPGVVPETVSDQFKAWGTRRLNERLERKRKWWTEGGSTRWLNDEDGSWRAVRYVRDLQ